MKRLMEIADRSRPLTTPPKTRVCYICGRQYGSSSYDIHLKQCKELWIAREEKKDPRDRKKLPKDPFSDLGINGNDTPTHSSYGGSSTPSSNNQSAALEEINRIASSTYNTSSLSVCAFCGRSFLPEKLVIHNRSCTADTPARKLTDAVRRGIPVPNISSPYGTSSDYESPYGNEESRNSKSQTVPKQEHLQRPSSGRTITSKNDETDRRKRNDLYEIVDGEVSKVVSSKQKTSTQPKTPRESIERFSPSSSKQHFDLKNRESNTSLNKSDMIVYLNNRVNAMEETALDLVESIKDVKEMLAKLTY